MPSSDLVCIRTDSSEQIGSGHVMRDLVLAQALRRRGSNVEFACRVAQGDSIAVLESAGFMVHRLSENNFSEASDAIEVARLFDQHRRKCSLLVVDHYGLGSQWESSLRSRVGRILVIDDLANRAHDCDILLDLNPYQDMERRYNGLVPSYCKCFIGPRFALLREEFRQIRPSVSLRTRVQRILVFMGGADAGNATCKALVAASMLGGAELVIDVVVGRSNPHTDQVKAQCENLSRVYFHHAVENMAELTAAADVAISAGGTSLWERCYLGLPSVAIAIADNQIEQLRLASSAGCVIFLGDSGEVSAERIARTVEHLVAETECLRRMSAACFQLMSANQCEQQLLEVIFETRA
jgi:UDP-2,4-diacetamido-2,4,6-trideoxy-beta-L-altropyranose hydrolase